uniref:Uncharacterized protein n=1 Tax=Anguilla anguilla TaxID=7936 RepID=A0A0E9QTR9_ANGAN
MRLNWNLRKHCLLGVDFGTKLMLPFSVVSGTKKVPCIFIYILRIIFF